MGWKEIFQNYHIAEIGKNGKEDSENTEQLSQISLFPPNVELDNLIDQLKSYYYFNQDDIINIKDCAFANLDGVITALHEQVKDLELLKELGLVWENVLPTLLKTIDELCDIKKYSAQQRKGIIDNVYSMSAARMLREIKKLKQELLVKKCK